MTCFVLLPLILFGISSLFEQDSKGYVVLGSIVVIILGLSLIAFIYKWMKGGLKERTIAGFERRQRAKQTYTALPDDMEMIKAELARLREHTGLPEPEPASDETDEEAA